MSAFVVATLAYLLIAAGVEAGGGNVTTGGPPGLVISATLVQDVALIAAAVVFAGMWTRGLTPASFGLRHGKALAAVGWTLLTWGAFFVLTAIYIKAVGEPDQQELTRDLAEEESLAALVGYGVLLAFVAPLTEEFFFRGFVFGVMRERVGVSAARSPPASCSGRARRRVADRDRRRADHPRRPAVRAVSEDRLAAALHRAALANNAHLLRGDQRTSRSAGRSSSASAARRRRSPSPPRSCSRLSGSADSVISRCRTRGMPPSAWAARMRSAPLPSRTIRSISSSAGSAPTSRA